MHTGLFMSLSLPHTHPPYQLEANANAKANTMNAVYLKNLIHPCKKYFNIIYYAINKIDSIGGGINNKMFPSSSQQKRKADVAPKGVLKEWLDPIY